jgi:23S rRNA pseudouridine1911/1915/1917 synthase
MQPSEIQQRFAEVEFTVEPNYAGWRLDKYLRVKIPRLSRTRIQRIIERGLVGEKALKPSSLVTPGLRFRLRRPILEEPQTPGYFAALHRDEQILVLDKPTGLPVHPTARYHNGTLVMLLRRLYGDGFQAWPVHRLDRETSGVLVCALTRDTARMLMGAFAAGRVRKQYLAICEGWPEGSFRVDAPIAPGGARVRVAVHIDAAAGKPAVTRFEVLRRFRRAGERFSLLRACPETGRQHQIRVHLKEAGFPIVGDKIYGPDEGYFDRFSRRQLEPEAWNKLRLPRHALHAFRIDFEHPGTAARVEFQSPLPADLRSFMDGLDRGGACFTPRSA